MGIGSKEWLEMERGCPTSVCDDRHGHLAIASHIKIEDLVKASPNLAPWQPKIDITPKPIDIELVIPCPDADPGGQMQVKGKESAPRPYCGQIFTRYCVR
jgi:hypothetical protein